MSKSKARPTTKKRQILIVDDHPMMRYGMAQFINQQPDLHASFEAEDASQALEYLHKQKADLAIVDIGLRGYDGIELVKRIRIFESQMPILVLTMYDEALYAERALRAGANGYVMKRESHERILEAIRTVLRGETYLTPHTATGLIDRLVRGERVEVRSAVELLSDRELEVLRLIGQGLGTQEIARKLSLSPKTVEVHRIHVKDKLGVERLNELIRFAVRWYDAQEQQ